MKHKRIWTRIRYSGVRWYVFLMCRDRYGITSLPVQNDIHWTRGAARERARELREQYATPKGGLFYE